MREWKQEEIKSLLSTSDEMVKRSLIQLYNQQTSEERYNNRTINLNGKGFNGVDGKLLTGISKFYLDKGFLSEKQLELVRRRIMKYSKQLTCLANQYELAKGGN